MADTNEDVEDLRNEIARSSYAGMLHDTERNKKYYDAMRLTITAMKSNNNNKGISVLDIGSGTGILSMMAARSGADQVTACEMFEPMYKTSKQIITLNNLDQQIIVINKCSNDLLLPDDMDDVADLLVTEVFDTELIGEGVIPILNDAHHRLLKPECKVIPEGADIKVQLIESDYLWCMNQLVPNKCNLDIHQKFQECPGIAAAHELQINQLYPDRLRLLSESIKIQSFDFEKPYTHNFNAKISMREKEIKITSPGSIHAVLFWYDLHLSKEHNLVVSMEPVWERTHVEYVWRDHWMQAVYYLRTPLKVKQGDEVFLKLYFDDFSIWFDVTKTPNLEYVDRPLCSCKLHTQWPRERFAMWNNEEIQSQIQRYTKHCDGNSLLIANISLLPLYEWRGSVTYLECSESQLNIMESSNDKTSNNNVIFTKDCNEPSSLSVYDNVVIEPYFSSCLLPWEHLFKFWRIHKGLSSKCFQSNLYSNVTPHKAQLKACVVSLHDLWKVRSPVQCIEGFDVSPVDELINDALSPTVTLGELCETVEPFSMWEYKCTLLSKPTVLAEFDMKSPLKDVIHGRIHLENAGLANAVVLWVDYIDKFNNHQPRTTGLDKKDKWVNYSRQGVYFLKNPHKMVCDEIIKYCVVVLPDREEMMFRFS